MKKTFNAVGTAPVQSTELLKNPTERAVSMLQMRTNLEEWLDERFLLSASQKE